ncbi:MAG: hypothetical protein KJN76_02805 [Eudoraea sp.]|nr:hypothetical protein [Eudoraea sp.]
MNQIRQVFSIVKQESPILYWITIVMFFGAIACSIGLFIDDRTVMGINVWLKPLKFFISTGIYIITVGFLITLYPYSNLKKHIIRNLVSWSLLLEMVIVTLQAAKGVQSHYNMSTALDGVMFAMMGILIGVNVFVMFWFAFDTARLKLLTPKSIQWAIFLGWLIIIFGSYIGGQMIGQMAHNVGIKDGGVGLPFLNWSTLAGDLRVAHFFGLHSIQIMPLFGYFVFKLWKTKHSNQVIVISIFGLLLASFILYTYVQAEQGIPFIGL